MKLRGGAPLAALCEALREREHVHVDNYMRRVDCARDNMYHKFKVVKTMPKDEISRRDKQLGDERKAALRDYLSAKSMFKEFFTATSAEKKNMFEDEWRMLATEKEWTDLTAVSKADLEVYYPRDGSVFDDYHKSLNRNYYVDVTSSLRRMAYICG